MGFLGGFSDRIFQPMQETRVKSPIWEDPTCCRATKPVHPSYWACALEPGNQNYQSPEDREPVLCNERSHHSEKSEHHNWRVAPLMATRETTEQHWNSKSKCQQGWFLVRPVFLASRWPPPCSVFTWPFPLCTHTPGICFSKDTSLTGLWFINVTSFDLNYFLKGHIGGCDFNTWIWWGGEGQGHNSIHNTLSCSLVLKFLFSSMAWK